MKMASVYLRKGILYLHANSQTSVGAWISAPPFLSVGWGDPDVSAKVNGAVSRVLEESRQGVPHPTEWDLGGPLYQLAGVRSWGEFATGDCKLVRVEGRVDGIYVVPQTNCGPRGGFEDCAEPILCSEAELSDWKTLLMKAFALCK